MRSRIALALFLIPCCQTFAQLDPPPASIDRVLTTPNHDYLLKVDDDPASTHYYPVIKALIDTLAVDRDGPFSIGNPRGYHPGYTDFGFDTVTFDDGLREIFYWDCANLPGDDCDNGGARSKAIHMPAPSYIGVSSSCTRMVLGHEIFHMIQRTYRLSTAPNSLGAWVNEGHARALQDKIYTDLDVDPDASCIAPYLGQVKSYLRGNPGNGDPPRTDDPLWTLSYDAALFWTYLMEQYGDIFVEPNRGIDFLVDWYDQALAAGESGNSLAITDATIQAADDSQNLLSTYRSFVLANLIKDMNLSGVSENFRLRYSYRDEELTEGLDQDLYAEVLITDTATVSDGNPDEAMVYGVEDYAVRYYRFDVAGCSPGKRLKMSFEPAEADPFFGLPLPQTGAWGIVVGRGGPELADQRPIKFYRKIDDAWSVELIQPASPYDSVYMTTTAVDGVALGQVRVQCLTNSGTASLPFANPLDPQTPGPPDQFNYGEVDVCVDDDRLLPVRGFEVHGFIAEVGGLPAPVLGGIRRDDCYRLFVEFPPQESVGPHDLAVTLGDQRTVVADAVIQRRESDLAFVMVLLDTSATMSQPTSAPKLDDAVAAVEGLLEFWPGQPQNRLGLIDFNFAAQIRVSLESDTESQRTDIRAALANLGADGLTALGDAVELARQEFDRAETAQGVIASKHVLLLADGPLSVGATWDDIRADVVASGMTIHTRALGPLADQGVLSEIAAATGGTFDYIPMDQLVGEDLALAFPHLVNSVLRSLPGHLQQVDEGDIPLQPDSVNSFKFEVPPRAISLITPAVHSARRSARCNVPQAMPPTTASAKGTTCTSELIGDLQLLDPNGESVLSFPLQHVSITPIIYTAALEPGTWTIELQTTSTASAIGDLELHPFVDVPAGVRLIAGHGRPETDSASTDNFVVGDSVDLFVSAHPGSANFALADGSVRFIRDTIQITAPDGTLHKGVAGISDGTSNTIFLGEAVGRRPAVTQTRIKTFVCPSDSPSGYPDDGATGERGTIGIKHVATLEDDGHRYQLITHDAFHVLRSGRQADRDGDNMPDAFEERSPCLDPDTPDATADPDGDGLPSIDEPGHATDPCEADTDGGGEIDGSEVAGGRDPFDLRDDALPGMDFAFVDHQVTDDEPPDLSGPSIRIRYASDPAFARIAVHRSTNPPTLPTPYAEISFSDPEPGIFVDSGVVAGTEYCYQLEPFDAAGNAGRRSAVFCAVARSDPAEIWASVVVNDGHPRTDDRNLEVHVNVYNKDTRGFLFFPILNDAQIGDPIPYAPTFVLTAPVVSVPTKLRVGVAIDDPGDDGPPPVFTDEIVLYPEGTLGGVRGQISLVAAKGAVPASSPPAANQTDGQVLVFFFGGVAQVCADGQAATACVEPTLVPEADGSFELGNLVPGNYLLYLHPGWIDTTPELFEVAAGQVTELGDFTIDPDALFASGFEGVGPF